MHPILETLGGIGLFLYGMAAMTSGLQKLAGERLRLYLARSTRTPLTGVVTGAAATAVVQSSSATTVAAVGFAGAGLLPFEQALGIIFGANIGTTITGWMVALIGFKLQLSAIALPLLFVAALLYLFKRYRAIRGSGKALAGFCLIFIGIGYLQQGLAGYQDAIDLSRWGTESFGGRLLLVLAGVILTLITQSSSATVATALTALNASVLTLPQAAAIIIGADIGTTVTAGLATIGGSTASRRTGFAHVIYNVITGVAAFLALPFYLWAVEKWNPTSITDSPEVVAVTFHTVFNGLGVLLVLPFTKQFAHLITRLIPDRTPAMVAAFDRRLLVEPGNAIEALSQGTARLANTAYEEARNILAASSENSKRLDALLAAIAEARAFALAAGTGPGAVGDPTNARLFNALHAIDHLERLCERLLDERRAQAVRTRPDLTPLREKAQTCLAEMTDPLEPHAIDAIGNLAQALEEDRPHYRVEVMKRAAARQVDASDLDAALDGHRWLRRIVYHAWRIAHYQRDLNLPPLPAPETP